MSTTDKRIESAERRRLDWRRAPRATLVAALCSCGLAATIPASAQSDQPAKQAAPTPPPATAPAPQPAGAPVTPAAPPAPANPQPIPAAAEAAKSETKPAETSGTPATVIDGQQIESLLGKSVESKSGEDMGRIVDILAEKNGQMRAAIIDFGGFFGVGSRKIAVDWRSLHFPADPKSDKVIVDLPGNQLRVAPVYKEGEPVVVLGPGPATATASGEKPAAPPSLAPGPVPATAAPATPAAPAGP